MTTQINQTPLERIIAGLLQGVDMAPITPKTVVVPDEDNADMATWEREIKGMNVHYVRLVRIHPGTPVQEAFYVNYQQENGRYAERAVMHGTNRVVTIRNDGLNYVAHISGKDYAVTEKDLAHVLQDSQEEVKLKIVA